MNAIEKATARPWTSKRVKTSIGYCFKIGSLEQVSGDYGAICLYDDQTSHNPRKNGQAEADTALIVKAVNEWDAHEAVVEAAKEYIGLVPKKCGHEFDCVCSGDNLSIALKSLDALRAKEGEVSTQIETLGDALPKELRRCQELLGVYIDLGPVGFIGATMIRTVIEEAQTATASGDVVAMLRAYEKLKGCQ